MIGERRLECQLFAGACEVFENSAIGPGEFNRNECDSMERSGSRILNCRLQMILRFRKIPDIR